ncbi:MAG: ATP-binding protein [Elusimicrobiota bacterium]|nr:ATP-binding protein [Elusimicrobiota bacterium]
MERIQKTYIWDKNISWGKMIFLSGPRQVGKTTFARKALKKRKSENLYFNWDDPFVFRMYNKNPHFLTKYLAACGNRNPLAVFDEIHKIKNWKNIVKGIYDVYKDECQFLITGSARLEYFTKSGDSLAGRYFHYRMFPLGLSEAVGNLAEVMNDDSIFLKGNGKKLLKFISGKIKDKKADFTNWLEFGGFPEPFLKSSARFTLKWQRNYLTLLTREDIRELTRINDISGLEQLVLMLPGKTGSPLSINSLSEDLNVNYRTVFTWLEALKKIYLVFSIMPWTSKINRALKKEHKYYFYDWAVIKDKAINFENAVAVSLLRMVNRWNEYGMGDYGLRYIRDRNKKEVDFLIIKNGNPLLLIECKLHDSKLSQTGKRFSDILGVPYIQLVTDKDVLEAYKDDKYLISAPRFLYFTG